ncbi:MAG: LytR C-terminal domain-containing protein [bacterium]
MRRAKRGMEKGTRFGAALLILITLLVIFFTASLVFRVVHELPYMKEESVPAGIRVEVLNGSGHDRMARKVAAILRRRGFDVVNIDNAESQDFERTVVVDRVSSDMRYAKILARKIGCEQIIAQPDPSLYLEVSVIVGNDCMKLFPELMKDRWQ